MATVKLTDSTVSITGRNFVADRSVEGKSCGRVLTYRPHGGSGDGMDVNELVYELMIIAASDMLDAGTVLYSGQYTAAELAGKAGYVDVFYSAPGYKSIRIEAGTFSYGFECSDVFCRMAEWEGAAGIPPKKAYRFACEAERQVPKVDIKPYKRFRCYTPKKVSYADDDRRIAEKLKTLGRLSDGLNGEGMRKALSLLTAVNAAGSIFDYGVAKLAEEAMYQWHWGAYRKDGSAQPVAFTAKDFADAPQIWRQVDEKYAQGLLARFKRLLADNPAPSWASKGAMVQMREQDMQPRKWQGCLKVCGVYGMLNGTGTGIVWLAEVCTTKGKWNCTSRTVGCLEPWKDPGKPKRKTARRKTANAKEEQMPAVKPLTPAEQLRQALLTRIAA